MTTNLLRSFALAGALFALLVSGCSTSSADEPKPQETGTLVAQAGPGPIAAPPAAPMAVTTSGVCQKYQAALCKAAGERSFYCEAFKVTIPALQDTVCAEGLKDVAGAKAKIEALRKTCVSLVERLCADLGAESQSCGLVRAKTPEFPTDQCQQMWMEYEGVLASLKAEEAKNRPLDANQRAKIEGHDGAAFGPKGAKVTVVEFSDFECPYCSRAAAVANQIKQAYPKKVRFVFRHFPLSFHQNAHLTSQASMAANAQGKFWPYHDLIFQNQRALSRKDLESYAEKLSLNMKTFKAALDKGTYKGVVDGDLALGGLVSVNGTPSMFINGIRVPNPTDFQAVQSIIDAELAK